MQDDDPYVRKTAAVCVAKLHDINAELVEDRGFLDTLKVILLAASFDLCYHIGSTAAYSSLIVQLLRITQTMTVSGANMQPVGPLTLLFPLRICLQTATQWLLPML